MADCSIENNAAFGDKLFMTSISNNFFRNVRGYLSSSRLNGVSGAGRLTRKSSSLSITPVDPIDSLIDTYSFETASQYRHRLPSAVTQLLSETVLNNLIQLQSELSQLDEEPQQQAIVTSNADAARAYQRTQDNSPQEEAALYLFPL